MDPIHVRLCNIEPSEFFCVFVETDWSVWRSCWYRKCSAVAKRRTRACQCISRSVTPKIVLLRWAWFEVRGCNGCEMSFPYIHYLARCNFVISVSHKNNRSLSTLCKTMHLLDDFVCNRHSFGKKVLLNSYRTRRDIVLPILIIPWINVFYCWIYLSVFFTCFCTLLTGVG